MSKKESQVSGANEMIVSGEVVLKDMSTEALSDISVWIFDLDNTLYPPSSPIFDQIDRRMTEFIADFLKTDAATAYTTQKSYYRKYGTSLCGLMNEHGMTPDAFLDYVHDIDHTVLKPNPELAEALKKLPGRRLIYTNGSATHAEAVLHNLGLDGVFEAIFDIRASDFIPKPHAMSYEKMIKTLAVDPTQAVFVEDSLKNLPPAAEIGMKTVWLCNHRDTSGLRMFDPNKCDAVIDNLGTWLNKIYAATNGAISEVK